MQRLLLGSAFAAAAAIATYAQPARPAPIVSPQVNADKTVTLRFRAPNARSVELIGELEGKPSYPMTKDDATGVWSVTIGPLAHDVYNYQFRVDAVNGQGGVIAMDPLNPSVKLGFGSKSIGAPRTRHHLREVAPLLFKPAGSSTATATR